VYSRLVTGPVEIGIRGNSNCVAESRKDRIARNEALFRVVNERVREVRPEEGDGLVGFLCECGYASCTETVHLTVTEYEAVRSEPTHFSSCRATR
jgi:hypothetical protein